jgi:hypothetical protein
MSDTAIRMAVISRIPWIKKQQSTFSINLVNQFEKWSVGNAIMFGVKIPLKYCGNIWTA